MLTLITILSGAAVLAQSPDVAVTVSVEREIVETGADGQTSTRLEPVDATTPGDVLVYTVRAVNRGVTPAVGARIVDPIPDGTVLLLDDLAAGERPTRVSIDGGRSWQGFPARVQQVELDGRARLVAAPAESYTHLRWDLTAPLAPGESRDVSFKVRVN